MEEIGQKMGEAQQLKTQLEAKIDRAYGLIQILYERDREVASTESINYQAWVDSLEIAVDSTVLWAGQLQMPNMRGIPMDKVDEHLDNAEAYLDEQIAHGRRHHDLLDQRVGKVKNLLK